MSSITDPIEIEKINNLSIDDYISALHQLENKLSKYDRKMLQTHFESSDYEITATKLAKKVGFNIYSAANLHYGRLAKKFCQIFQVTPDEHLSSLVIFKKINGEWHWYLRPQLVAALEQLKWFNYETSSIIQEIDGFRSNTELDTTTVESIVQSRLGQGQFRSNLIAYWQGCAVTNCQLTQVLRASHIKPWRNSTNEERLDPWNGLLLIPNLDVAFDLGLISFKNDGSLIISPHLDDSDLLYLGISREMTLRKRDAKHHKYLEFHRDEVFQK